MIAWHETSWHTILLSTKASIWSNSNCYDPKQQKAISKFQTSHKFSRVLNLHPGLYDPESRQQCVVPKLSPHPIYTNTTPPTPHWRHRLLYLSLNLPVPATNNAAPPNVFATNADCTSDWLYLLFATSYCTTGTAPAPPHQSLCHHRKFHRSQSCNATKSCETVQLYFKFNIFCFLGFKIKCG